MKKYRFTEEVVKRDLLKDFPFVLVDVGASGGIDSKWYIFKNCLKAVGFDPLLKECERLNRENVLPGVEYVAAYVGCKNKKFPETDNELSQRLSAFYANEILGLNPLDRYNSFQELFLSNNYITLSDYFKDFRDDLDFLKIDTDGHEIEVLHGADELFKRGQFLGVYVEAPFHGDTHPLSNTFANIDMFLRQRGFSLFDIEVYRYSRKDLPGRFLIEIPAQTDIGQVVWADVLYLRDLGSTMYLKKFPDYKITPEKILKLICIFELFDLNDCAIEVLNVYKNQLKNKIKDIENVKELLVPPIEGKYLKLKDYFDRFNRYLLFVKNSIENNFEKRKSYFKKYKKVGLFGAGGRLKNNIDYILSFFNDSTDIIIFDNDKNKLGKKIKNIKIYSPDKIKHFKPELIIITSTFANEIFFQLKEIQYKYNIKFDVVFY